MAPDIIGSKFNPEESGAFALSALMLKKIVCAKADAVAHRHVSTPKPTRAATSSSERSIA
jgi:methionine-rich copper-binding protein CopC